MTKKAINNDVLLANIIKGIEEVKGNDIDILDLDTMTWISPQVSGTIPMARNAHTMTVLGKKLYLFGGHSGNKHLKDLHVFDTETLSWTEP